VTTQLYGLLIYRFAEETILPFSYNGYEQRLRDYYSQLQAMLLQQNVELDLTQLSEAIDNFEHASDSVSQEIKNLQSSGDKQAILELNTRLAFSERQFLIPSGLPQRHWFKHVLQAPGILKGYGSVVFPGIDDALSENNYTQAVEQLQVISQHILATSNFLRGGEKTSGDKPTSLSETTIIVVAIVGVLLFIFMMGVVIYFRRFRKVNIVGDEEVSLIKKDLV